MIEQAKEQVETLTEQIQEKYKAESENLKKSIVSLNKAIAVLQRARDAQAFAQVSTLMKEALKPFAQQAMVKTVLDDRQVQAVISAPVVNGFLQVSETMLMGGADHIIGVLAGLLDAFKQNLA